MRCPTCGNEVNAGEAFCGQCGTPNQPATQSREMANIPSQLSGRLNGYPPANSFVAPSGPLDPRTPMQSMPSSAHMPSLQGRPYPSAPAAMGTPVQNQQTEFYQDATEAMSVPNMPGYQGPVSNHGIPGSPQSNYGIAGGPQSNHGIPNPISNHQSIPNPISNHGIPGTPAGPNQGYMTPQQNFSGAPMQGNYPGAVPYGTQMSPRQYQATGYTNPMSQQGYAQPQYSYEQQGYDYGTYGTRPSPTPSPPARQQNNTVILIVSICLVGVLISVVGLATLYFTKNSSPSTDTTGTPIVATSPATAAPSPTVAPTPTPSPTIAPTPTPSVAVATVPPDNGFLLCGPTCNNYNFTTEYPSTWQPGATPGVSGLQFANPAATDQFASFKAAGPTTSSASMLVTGDLQTNFASKAGYVAPTTSSTTTISGETWATAVAYYQSDAQQQEHIEVYATVHQGKAYIIELQAQESQFTTVNSQYFVNMLGKFQFLS